MAKKISPLQNAHVVKICSIIIVTKNEARNLSTLKKAIDRLQRPPGLDIECILVDGGSEDRTVDLAQQLGFTKVISLPSASIPTCRNRGLSEARGVWIAFLDGDCEPASDWLHCAMPYLDTARPRIIGWPVEPPHPGTWVQRAWHAHWLHKNPFAMSRAPVQNEAFRLITTRNMLFHRSVLDRVGIFDERLTTGEDTDFVFRAQTQGIEVIAVPNLRVIHHGEPATLSQFFRQQLWHANRRSYQTILRTTAGRVGGNVIVYTISFLTAGLAALTGMILTLVQHNVFWLTFITPFGLVLMLPAALVSYRAKHWSLFAPLTVLYAAYGLARALDLVGFGRNKISWKSK